MLRSFSKKLVCTCTVGMLAILYLILPIEKVYADFAIDTSYVFNFYKKAVPYEDSVNFEVSCHGTSYKPDNPDSRITSIIEGEVLKLEAECEGFGCVLKENIHNYTRINRCTITGKTKDGTTFEVNDIEHLASNCTPIDGELLCVVGVDVVKNEKVDIEADELEFTEAYEVIIKNISEGPTFLQFMIMYWYVPALSLAGLIGLVIIVAVILKKRQNTKNE